ncbi:MAG: hypothetical protein EP338_10230 [Bacteroidetes bacterium]|nr:MAG: hypothetical protein EP338_10230 [Bacteroidota bacterium]
MDLILIFDLMRQFGRSLHFLFSGVLLLILASCGLRYTPVESPRDMIKKRQQMIIDQLSADFAKEHVQYQAVRFGQSITIKPPSHYTLDSLYGVKYELEKKGLINRELENQIALQRQVVLQDNQEIYYREQHIFSIKDSIQTSLIFADLSVNTQNQVVTMDIHQSHELEENQKFYFACFFLRESFLYPSSYMDESEEAFYEYYGEKFQQLQGKEQTTFLSFTLQLMKKARQERNLDKVNLIKQMVREYAQGTRKNYLNERFDSIEEFFDDQDQLAYYKVIYTFSVKGEENDYHSQQCELYLDPYLQLQDILWMKH